MKHRVLYGGSFLRLFYCTLFPTDRPSRTHSANERQTEDRRRPALTTRAIARFRKTHLTYSDDLRGLWEDC